MKILSLFFMIFSWCFGASIKSDLEAGEIKGVVKTQIHEIDDLIENRKRKVKTEFNKDGFIVSKQIFINDKFLRSEIYEYDEQNLLTKSIEGRSQSVYLYEKEVDGLKRTKISKTPNETKTTYTRYDKNGLTVAELVRYADSTNKDGWTIYSDTREYYDHGRLKSVTDGENGLIYEFEYHFEADGSLFQKTMRDYRSMQINYFVYEKQGGLALFEETDGKRIKDGQNLILSRYEYNNTYDKIGNITQIKATDKNGKLIRTEKFWYEYY